MVTGGARAPLGITRAPRHRLSQAPPHRRVRLSPGRVDRRGVSAVTARTRRALGHAGHGRASHRHELDPEGLDESSRRPVIRGQGHNRLTAPAAAPTTSGRSPTFCAKYRSGQPNTQPARAACLPSSATTARVTLSYMSEPSVVKSVRMPRDLLDGLVARAELERRTFNNLVIKILAEALDERPLSGRQPPADDHEATDIPADSKDAST